MSIGQRLSTARTLRGMRAGTLNREAGLGKNLVSQIENGRIENPTTRTIVSLCKVLNVSADYLLGLKPGGKK